MSAFRIRPAVVADASALSAIVLALIPDWLVPDGDAVATARMQREHSAEVIAGKIRDGWPYWLAETIAAGGVGDVLGYIALKPPAHLFNCYVRADQHGTGIGTALWQVLVDEIKRRGEAVITVNASLRSCGFYQKQGFVAVTPAQCFEGLYFQRMQCRIQPMTSDALGHHAAD